MATKKGLPNIKGKQHHPKTTKKKPKNNVQKIERKTSAQSVPQVGESIKRSRALSPTEKEYNKQLRRIKAFIKRASERGYEFEPDIIPQRPKRITKASVERLRKLTPQKMYEKAKYHTPEGDIISGTLGRKRERLEAAKKAKKTKELKKQRDKFYKKANITRGLGDDADEVRTPPSQTFTTLDNIRDELSQWSPEAYWGTSTDFARVKETDKNILENILNGAIEQYGEDIVGRRLEANSDEVTRIVQEVLYQSGSKEDMTSGRTQVNLDLARFSAIVMGRALTVEESKNITEQVEQLDVVN